MLTKEQQELINARLAGIKDGEGNELTFDKLTELQSSETEAKIEAPKVNLYTDEELTSLRENLSKEVSDEEYTKGKKVGAEQLIKELRNKEGLEFEGKTPENLLEALKNKYSNATTDEEVKEWKERYDALKNTYETEKEEYKGKIAAKERDFEMFNHKQTLDSAYANIEGIKPNQATTLFLSEYQPATDESGQQIVKNGKGEIIKDKLGRPIPLGDVAKSYAAEQGWVKEAGRGGRTETGASVGTFKNKEEAHRYLMDNKIDVDSVEGKELLAPFYQEN